MRKCEISRRVQRAVADVLTRVLFCQDVDDLTVIIQQISDDYLLESDPFTKLPISHYDYVRRCLEFDELNCASLED